MRCLWLSYIEAIQHGGAVLLKSSTNTSLICTTQLLVEIPAAHSNAAGDSRDPFALSAEKGGGIPVLLPTLIKVVLKRKLDPHCIAMLVFSPEQVKFLIFNRFCERHLSVMVKFFLLLL